MASAESEHQEQADVVLALSQHVLRLHALLDQRLGPALTRQGLTRAELDVLGTLAGSGAPYELRPKELRTRLLLTTGGVSNILRRLEARGLVSSNPDPADGRGQLVRLTTDGATTARSAAVAATAALERALSPVPHETLTDALHLLHRILNTVDEAPTLNPGPRHPAKDA
jgi:DNA-binding MarR family transcriptional regulator